MAYPATTRTLQAHLQDVDQKAALLRSATLQQFSLAAAGQLNVDALRRYYDLLKMVHVFFTSVAAIPGIAKYVATEKQGQVEDPAAEFAAMRAAVATTIDWLHDNLPTGSSGGQSYVLGFRLPADYTSPAIPLTVSAAQTAGYRTQLTALLATIE